MYHDLSVNVTGGTVSPQEIDAYVMRAYQQYPDKFLHGIDIRVDGEYVDLTYHWSTVPFERIRRVTAIPGGEAEFGDLSRREEPDRPRFIARQ